MVKFDTRRTTTLDLEVGMTEREQTFDLDTARLLRARRSADGVVAQYIRELSERRDECRAPAEQEADRARPAVAIV
jgi:hypothetical protein